MLFTKQASLKCPVNVQPSPLPRGLPSSSPAAGYHPLTSVYETPAAAVSQAAAPQAPRKGVGLTALSPGTPFPASGNLVPPSQLPTAAGLPVKNKYETPEAGPHRLAIPAPPHKEGPSLSMVPPHISSSPVMGIRRVRSMPKGTRRKNSK